MKPCAVCKNRSNITDKQTDDPMNRVTYHRIPANPERASLWVEACGITMPEGLTRKFICSDHFTEDCFEQDMSALLMDGVRRKVLKKLAIPSIRAPAKRKETEDLSEQAESELTIKKRKEEVDKLLRGEVPVVQPVINPFRKHPTKEERQAQTISNLQRQIDELEHANGLQQKKIVALEQAYTEERDKARKAQTLNEQKSQRINLAKAEMVNLAISLQELRDTGNKHVNERVKQILSEYFSEGQLACILAGVADTQTGSTLVGWTDDELAKSLELRCISVEAFHYMTDQFRYPLPEALQIENWIHGVYLEKGMNAAAIRMLESYTLLLPNPTDLICTLNLVRVDAPVRYMYDRIRDQIVGPNAQLHCVCVQGVFAEWKQIVHIDFDLVYGADLLKRLVELVHQANYRVVAITTPCDRESADIWSELEVSVEQHYILHPVTGDRIYLFPCPESSLTSIHRILLEEGFVLQETGVTVSKESLLQLIESQDPRITALLDFERRHLEREILNDPFHADVSRQLISHRTADALKTLAENDNDTIRTMATLLDLFSDWYELCTTTASSTMDNRPQAVITRVPYGACEDEQNIVLDGMLDTMESIRCVNEDYSYLPEGIMISIASVRKLLNELRPQFGAAHATGIPMQRLCSTPMYKTLASLQDAISVSSETCILSSQGALMQLCRAVSNAKQDTHVSNTLLEVAQLSNDIQITLPQEEPLDPDVRGATEPQACEFLTNLIADRMHQKYEYLGEVLYAIELQNDQYVVVPAPGNAAKVQPSPLWVEQAHQLETYVVEAIYHRKEGLVEGLVEAICQQHPTMERNLIEMYVSKRIAIKLQCLNAELDALGSCDATWLAL
ncbi:uncharacterized protein LOC125957126 [Anopheles darlingi]|uniref:uncharacterized protein LOC125957126 n=1 Tax=Anopheles darlingi TaxID=43151 RepID=UPI0021002CCF|nr:uncharacterized protein LOC125957126 [Anopheles darlingi]